MLFGTKRTDPSHSTTLTPLGCRLRTVLFVLAPVGAGQLSIGPIGAKAARITSGELEFGEMSVENSCTTCRR